MSFHQYANGFQAVPKLGLERIGDLLRRLGDPQKDLSCVHVAGTNGKGSVCMFLDAMLRADGRRVGRYLSPNLKKVNERISVDGEEIGDEDLSRILSAIEGASEETRKATGIAPTPFEIWTAAAFLYFKEKECDTVVLEVGMGGKFDATNVIEDCALAVITRLDLDHTAYLGNTLAEVAENKAGILKPRRPCVVAAQEEEALAVIRRRAAELSCPLTVAVPPAPVGFSEIYETFRFQEGDEVTLSLGGIHQLENAAVAVSAAEVLGVSPASIRRGLTSARHPARLEMLKGKVPTLFDGGHNPNGIAALTRALDRYYPGREETVIFACMADKDIAPSLGMLQNGNRRFVFTTVENNPRAMSAAALREKAASLGIEGEAAPTLREARALAEGYGRPILIAGSLYLYGDL